MQPGREAKGQVVDIKQDRPRMVSKPEFVMGAGGAMRSRRGSTPLLTSGACGPVPLPPTYQVPGGLLSPLRVGAARIVRRALGVPGGPNGRGGGPGDTTTHSSEIINLNAHLGKRIR